VSQDVKTATVVIDGHLPTYEGTIMAVHDGEERKLTSQSIEQRMLGNLSNRGIREVQSSTGAHYLSSEKASSFEASSLPKLTTISFSQL